MKENTSGGIFFYASNTQRFLYLLRNDKNNTNWGIPGGKIEDGETLFEGIERECIEEVGFFPTDAKLVPIQKFVNNHFTYHTFYCELSEEFMPTLNEEHCGYAWVEFENYPKPMHPGLFNTVNFDVVQDKLKQLIKKAA